MTLVRVMIGRFYIYTLYSMMVAFVGFICFVFFYILFMCKPISYTWTIVFDPLGGTCKPSHGIVNVTYALSSVMAAVDLSLALLAGVMVSSLHMDNRTKITVFVLLAFGSMYFPDRPFSFSVSFCLLTRIGKSKARVWHP
jgi:hypothetical protein